MRENLRCALVLAAVQAACTSLPEQPEVVVTGVEPAAGPLYYPVPVKITGEGFHVPLEGDLADDPGLSGSMEVSVGGVPLEDMVLRSETLIEGTVSSSTPRGLHGIEVTFSDGRNDTNNAFYEVAAPVLSITTAPQTLATDACSAEIVVQVDDGFGSPYQPPDDVDILLLSDSSTLLLYRRSACLAQEGSVTLPAGESTTSFFVRGTAPGQATITIEAPDFVSASQMVTVE